MNRIALNDDVVKERGPLPHRSAEHQGESEGEDSEFHAPPKVGFVSRFLLLASVVSLPFTAAGTLDIGFALKFYEIAVGLLFLIYVTKVSAFRRSDLEYDREERRAMYLAGAFALAAIVSSIFGYFVLEEYKSTIAIYSWKNDPSVASGLKCGYLLLDVFALFYIVGIKSVPVEQICNCWLVGSFLSAVYGWYLFSVSLSGHLPLVLPGQDHLQVGGSFFPEAIRCGTFLEGNYVATFYLLSAVVAFMMFFRIRKIHYGVCGLFFLVSILHTQSTCGLVAALVFILFLCFLIGISNQQNFILMIPAFAILTLAAIGAANTPYIHKIVIDKVSDDVSPEAATSRLEREDLIESGYQMFLDYPILGIGLSNFGFLYPYYTHFSVDKEGFDVAADKTIPNNIYSEISAETGVIGSIIFFSFCIYILFLYRKSFRGMEQRVVLAGLISLFVAWIAYPTFSLLFQWVFFALMIRIFLEKKKQQSNE